jgi:transketolase
LTRQNIPVFPRGEAGFATTDGVAKGAYVSSTPRATQPDVILIATGSEVQLAVAARETLAAEGIQARVVSAPSLEWFAEQDAAYRESCSGRRQGARLRRGGSTPLWRGIVGDTGRTVGIDHFGASADYKTLFEKFGITTDAVVEAARATVKENA